MLRKLMHCLTGPALEYAQTLGAETTDAVGNTKTSHEYRKLIDGLLEEFCPPSYGMLLHNKVRALIEPNQTIQQFAAYLV